MKRTSAIVLAFVLGIFPAAAFAQFATGNVYGTVTDPTGAALPGATITAGSRELGGAPRTTVSDKDGAFQFLNLDHGTYTITITMQGFSTLTRDVLVETGVSVTTTFGLKVGGLSETISVTGETPVVDTKQSGTSATFSRDELEKVPQGRDPWALLNRVPGVVVDRVSIAGGEAGQQSLFAAKGAQFTDTTWNLDGVNITDTTSYGASSMYFDFDAFDEMSFSTGGNDVKNPTGGIGLNFVTKRGTNAFHGSARGFFSNHAWGESNNTPNGVINPQTGQSIVNPSQLFNTRADSIQQIADYGFDLGGPIVKDKLWFWGSYGRNDIRLWRYASATNDKTILNNYNGKLNWQASSKDMVSFFFFNGLKDKFGRSSGAPAPLQTPDTTWNQGSYYAQSDCGMPCGLHGLFKLEDNHTFSPDFFLDVKYSYFGWGYGFNPVGGYSAQPNINLNTGYATGSWAGLFFRKPWQFINADAEYFVDGLGGRNEIKFGFGYRHEPNTSSIQWPAGGIVAFETPTGNYTWVARNVVDKFTGNYTSGYVADTFTKDRLTVNVGLRYDYQTASNDSSVAIANGAFPSEMPGITGVSTSSISWNDLSPRIGITYALDADRKTIIRASYARYAGQLSPPDITYVSAVPCCYNFAAYNWVDQNGDGIAQPGEILTGQGILYGAGINLNNTGINTSVNSLASGYHANHDNEFIVGFEREVLPNFSVSAAYTYRKGDGLVDWNPRVDANGNILPTSSYLALPAVSGGGYSVTPYEPNPALVGNGGHLLMNRPDYNQTYNGIELTALKRLRDKWQMRAAFTWQTWKENYTGPGSTQNPTPTDIANYDGFSNVGSGAYNAFNGPGVSGGVVAPQSYGSNAQSYTNATWTVAASGLYQPGSGFEIGASVTGRQGYPQALALNAALGIDGNVHSVVGPLDLARYDAVWDVDVRVAKNFPLGGSAHLTLTVDCFNLFNSGVVLGLVPQLNSGAAGSLYDVINPRILRYGVRLGF
jgi:hypothetical protein